ncbi:MAG TPA: glycosyltransferase family A protein [Ktedonobacterales bacterium]|nr:glycosyltransferase family A protein [Ktedonobacterales bacterium]
MAMASVDVLIATYNRPESLVMTLAGVAAQTQRDLRVIVADQSDKPVGERQTILTLRRVIEARDGTVEWHSRTQVHGIAEQRDFLLKRARADAVLYLDDDVLMEPWVVERLLDVLRAEGCGFVGAFPAGLSHRDDVRPAQQIVERWEGPVRPEVVAPGSPAWERWQLHRAANVYHAAQRLAPGEVIRYKVAWIASCILYHRAKLLAVGGFAFWRRLPRFHSGEEVLVQNLLMRRWGGCAILPCGTYYAQEPTTVLNARGTVDGHALDLLPEMVARYVAPFSAQGMHAGGEGAEPTPQEEQPVHRAR